jgi:membrane protease YdiL (CAAX protease family)
MRAIWSTLLVYGIAFVSVFGLQLVAVTALLTWRTGAVDLDRDGLSALLVAVPASSLTLIAIALVAAGRPRSQRLRLVPSGVPAREILVMVAGILALSQALESLVLLLGVGTGPALEWMTRTMGSTTPLGLALALVVVGLLAPIGEELFFRGYMLTRLRQAWSPGPAILVSAIAFGIIHGEWVHGLLAAGIGVYLGLVTERSGSVVPAMICHAVNNTASVLLSAWLGSPHGRALNATLVIAMGLVVVWALGRLRRAWPIAA